MSLVRAKGTKPELELRRLVHCMGYRCRLHRRDLPSTPDQVFPGRLKVIFMNAVLVQTRGLRARQAAEVAYRVWAIKADRELRSRLA